VTSRAAGETRPTSKRPASTDPHQRPTAKPVTASGASQSPRKQTPTTDGGKVQDAKQVRRTGGEMAASKTAGAGSPRRVVNRSTTDLRIIIIVSLFLFPGASTVYPHNNNHGVIRSPSCTPCPLFFSAFFLPHFLPFSFSVPPPPSLWALMP